MKFILLLLIPAFIHAQEAPRKCTTIYVKGVTFVHVQEVLADNGFFVDKKDNEVQSLYTVPSAVEKGVSEIIYIRVKDSTATITGKWNMPGAIGNNNPLVASFGAYSPIMKVNSKSNMNYEPWEIMNNLAKKMGGIVVYTKD